MRNLIPFLTLAVILTIGPAAYGQMIERSFIGNQGQTVSAPNISITYNVGEFVADLFANTPNSAYLTAGFSQPDVEIQLVNTDLTKNLIAFPNPTASGKIKLSFINLPNSLYSVQVIDALGRVLQSQTADYHDHNFYYIDMDISSLKGGLYFIRVTGSSGFRGDVKIVRL